MDSMNYNERLLFYLLRIGLETETKYDFVFTERPDWKFIFKMSSKQGVLAIVFDGLDYLINNNLIDDSYRPSQSGKMRWAMNVMNIEKVCDVQYKLASELAEIYAQNGIETVVLKGIACSVDYPRPNHRPCGDLDCYLMGNYEEGNKVAISNGAKYGGCDAKHAHLNYKGLEIENHQYCTSIAGPKRRKNFERSLQSVLCENGFKQIKESKLLSPNSLFNALFLTEHSWRHFLGEEVRLRQYCDWAMLLKNHNEEINWEKFVDIINKRDKNLLNFARCASVMCHECMGSPIPQIFANNCTFDDLCQKMLHSILYDEDPESIPSKGLERIYIVIKRSLKKNWRKDKFSEDTALYNTYIFLWTHIFERHPHL